MYIKAAWLQQVYFLPLLVSYLEHFVCHSYGNQNLSLNRQLARIEPKFCEDLKIFH